MVIISIIYKCTIKGQIKQVIQKDIEEQWTQYRALWTPLLIVAQSLLVPIILTLCMRFLRYVDINKHAFGATPYAKSLASKRP